MLRASLLCLTVLCLVPVPCHAKPPKPGVPTLTISPRIAMAGVNGALVNVRAVVADPMPEMFCPSVELTVYGAPLCDATQAMGGASACDQTDEGAPTYHTKSESDCEPWKDVEEVIVEPDGGGRRIPPTREIPFSWERTFRLGGGDWTFQVTIQQGAKKFRLYAHMEVR